MSLFLFGIFMGSIVATLTGLAYSFVIGTVTPFEAIVKLLLCAIYLVIATCIWRRK